MTCRNRGRGPGHQPASFATTEFLQGGGETGTRIRDFNGSTTSLGPIEQWSKSLKTAIGMTVRSPVPIVMLWGSDGIMIYNDAYSVFASRHHPKLLGSRHHRATGDRPGLHRPEAVERRRPAAQGEAVAGTRIRE
ncbi:MAG: hypothetical protein H7312_08920 [Tardiphaga sp.]|nr:hypothetical protein [Tardiphaga sp.]